MKSLSKIPLIAALFAVQPLLFAQTTGFNKAEAGPWDYNTSGNWMGGLINGIWDSSLTLTAAQTATFGADTVLETGLDFLYTGNFDLTLRSDGIANRTITLGGDILVNPVSNRTITIGSITANQGLNVDLGGDRTFTLPTSKTLQFYNAISGGDITLVGNNPTAVGGTFRLARDNATAASSHITVKQNVTLEFDSSTSGNVGAVRTQDVTLASGGRLRVRGNGGADSVNAISGSLIIDGSEFNPNSANNSISTITVEPGGSRNTLLTVDELERVDRGVVRFRGVNLGTHAIASAGAGGNIEILGTAPTLVGGGGGAGTTTISILPWAIGGTTASDTGSTFVTYTADNGIRTLDVNTEYATAIGGNAADNVRLTSNTTLDTNATVNSLLIGGAGASLSGSGTLTVTSGAVFNARSTGAVSDISVNLDFGAAEGVIGANRGTTFAGAISGSGGLTVYGTRTDEIVSFTNASSTYTGDTTVLGNMGVSTGFLPHADRSGNVHLYGNLQLSASGYNGTINGLYGSGYVRYGNSGQSSITIGDNNADGLFTGAILGNSNLRVIKIGDGTQAFTGEHTYANFTSVRGGVLEVSRLANGGVASGIGQSSSAASNLVLDGGTLRYTGETAATDRLFAVGTSGGGLDASGVGAVDFTNVGANVSAEAANRTGARTADSNVITGVTNFSDLVVGARVNGAGITAGTTITAIDTVNGTITLSANATANSSAAMSFSTDRSLLLTGANTDANTISGVLANSVNGGALSVTKSGGGTWVLAGANTYTGATTVNAGTLLVNGTLAAGSEVAVTAGTLGGAGDGVATGIIAGATTLSAGAKLAPGAEDGLAGNLTFSNGLDLSASSNDTGAYLFNLNAVGASDRITLTSGVANALNVGTLDAADFSFVTGVGFGAGVYVLFDANSAIAGNIGTALVDFGGGITGTLSIDSINNDVLLTVVPEPSTTLLLTGGLMAGVLLRRRRI